MCFRSQQIVCATNEVEPDGQLRLGLEQKHCELGLVQQLRRLQWRHLLPISGLRMLQTSGITPILNRKLTSWLGTLWTSAFTVRFFDGNADLALIEELRAIGVFVH
jgi:hypothetical protein